MKIYFYICCTFLFASCFNASVTPASIITKDLQAQATNDEKELRIDTLLIVSQNDISAIEVVEEELMFLRRFNSELKETVDLNLKLKKLLEKDLNEINYLSKKLQNNLRRDRLQEEISGCDSMINLYQPRLTANTNEINNILSKTKDIKTDQLLYCKTTYFIKGLVGQKKLNDTVVTFINKDDNSVVSFTNLLYVEEK